MEPGDDPAIDAHTPGTGIGDRSEFRVRRQGSSWGSWRAADGSGMTLEYVYVGDAIDFQVRDYDRAGNVGAIRSETITIDPPEARAAVPWAPILLAVVLCAGRGGFGALDRGDPEEHARDRDQPRHSAVLRHGVERRPRRQPLLRRRCAAQGDEGGWGAVRAAAWRPTTSSPGAIATRASRSRSPHVAASTRTRPPTVSTSPRSCTTARRPRPTTRTSTACSGTTRSTADAGLHRRYRQEAPARVPPGHRAGAGGG